jgi:hypothetical protein
MDRQGLHVRGDERVLDMSCGRSAVLIAVARRLTSGRVIGIDLWSTRDQSGNASDVTRRDASLEGVLDRVEIETGDIRAPALYARTLDALGATTTRRRLGWRFWYGNPIAAASLVTATKPLDALSRGRSS